MVTKFVTHRGEAPVLRYNFTFIRGFAPNVIVKLLPLRGAAP